MDNIKNPSESQKEIIREYRLVPDNWKVVHESKSDLEIINRRGRRYILKK